MLAFFNLIGGVKGMIIIALIAALGGYIWLQKHKVDVAEAAVVTAQGERDVAKKERDIAVGVAKTNSDTIEQLKNEKQLVNDALNSLSKSFAANASSAKGRETIILNQASNPANQSVVAPVISTIISDIQVDRAVRRGLPPPAVEKAAEPRIRG